MAVIGSMGDRDSDGRNHHQSCLDATLLQAARPSTSKGITIFRPIPQVGENGDFRPMVNGETPSGLDFSNFRIENVVISAGKVQKFSGLGRDASLTHDECTHFDMVFPALYIRLKSMIKKKEVPEHLIERVRNLFEGGLKSPFRSPKDMLLCQGIVTHFNDAKLEKPRPKQCIFLTSTAAEALAECLTKAYKAGIDVFHPTEGRAIILTPEKQRGVDLSIYNAELGDKVPLPVEACKKLWVPWERGLKLQSREDHLRAAIKCFGRELVELAHGEELEELFGVSQVAAQHTLASEAVATSESEPVAAGSAAVAVETAEEPANTLQIDLDLPADGPLGDDEGEEEVALKGSVTSDAGGKGNGVVEQSDPEDLAAQFAAELGDDL